MSGKYAFLGDADGRLLPASELADKLEEAQSRFNAISDPNDVYEAIKGKTGADMYAIFERCAINHKSIMRIFGAAPESVPLDAVEMSATAIAKSANAEHPIPSDIEAMVRSYARTLHQRSVVGRTVE